MRTMVSMYISKAAHTVKTAYLAVIYGPQPVVKTKTRKPRKDKGKARPYRLVYNYPAFVPGVGGKMTVEIKSKVVHCRRKSPKQKLVAPKCWSNLDACFAKATEAASRIDSDRYVTIMEVKDDGSRVIVSVIVGAKAKDFTKIFKHAKEVESKALVPLAA